MGEVQNVGYVTLAKPEQTELSIFRERGQMNRFLAILSLTFCTVCVSQAPQIKSGATVYIEPMDGYESYLAAALAKKRVPLIVVADKSKQSAPLQPAVVINNTVNNINNGSGNTQNADSHGGYPRPGSFGRTSASISVIDSRSSQIVFAYSVGKSANTDQLQSTAEACAKHLKEFIEKPGK
jgi:hypothetical protein